MDSLIIFDERNARGTNWAKKQHDKAKQNKVHSRDNHLFLLSTLKTDFPAVIGS